jgi:hypothetical protein
MDEENKAFKQKQKEELKAKTMGKGPWPQVELRNLAIGPEMMVTLIPFLFKHLDCLP